MCPDNLNLNGLTLNDRRDCNILTLGASGAGKSTWINSIANYCKHKSFNEALKHKPEVLIPTTICYMNQDMEEKKITVHPNGELESTEQVDDTSKSGTQHTQIYSFQDQDITYNIIDVPGINDSRGIEQDKINIANILDTVNQFNELHLICILIKATENKLTDQCEYNLNEILMTMVTRNAVKNVAFVFTNARGSEYRPGNAHSMIKDYLKRLKDTGNIDIELNDDNIFCVDSEAFKCQCIYTVDPDVIEEDVDTYELSWNKSLEATKALLRKAKSIRTVQTEDIKDVNEARVIVTVLIKPLATITTLIEDNLEKCFDALLKNVTVSEYDIHTTPLDEPRMVCVSNSCIGTDPGDPFTTYYKQICHDVCYIKGANVASFPEERLKQCVAMSDNERCNECGCPWDKHMHILYDQKKVKKKDEDCRINRELDQLVNSRDKEKKLEKYKEELREEQKIINESVAKFMVFLRDNAIMSYNNAYESYIKLEIDSAVKANNRRKIERFNKLLDEYKKVKAFIDSQQLNNNITVTNVNTVKNDLFKLKIYGKKIKELFDTATMAFYKAGEKRLIDVNVEYSLS